jgi:hypothetical protein
MSFTPVEELTPPSMSVEPPAVLRHLDDIIYWWANTPVPVDFVQIIGVNQGNEEYVAPNDVLAWHLHDNPVISDSAVEASGSLLPRRGPYAEVLDNLHCHFLENGGKLMRRISSLTDQYWEHRLVIKHGAPRLKHVNSRVTTLPRGHERDIVNTVEEF